MVSNFWCVHVLAEGNGVCKFLHNKIGLEVRSLKNDICGTGLACLSLAAVCKFSAALYPDARSRW
jgi:hypothetical protein